MGTSTDLRPKESDNKPTIRKIKKTIMKNIIRTLAALFIAASTILAMGSCTKQEPIIPTPELYVTLWQTDVAFSGENQTRSINFSATGGEPASLIVSLPHSTEWSATLSFLDETTHNGTIEFTSLTDASFSDNAQITFTSGSHSVTASVSICCRHLCWDDGTVAKESILPEFGEEACSAVLMFPEGGYENASVHYSADEDWLSNIDRICDNDGKTILGLQIHASRNIDERECTLTVSIDETRITAQIIQPRSQSYWLKLFWEVTDGPNWYNTKSPSNDYSNWWDHRKSNAPTTTIKCPGLHLKGNLTEALEILSNIPTLESIDLANEEKFNTIDNADVGRWNLLAGPIPASIGKLTNLKKLDLACLDLGGEPLPLELYMPQIEILQLTKCNIGGTIPPQIGECKALKQLWLIWNEGISGQLPPELFTLKNVTFIDIGGTSITGNISAIDICSMAEDGHYLDFGINYVYNRQHLVDRWIMSSYPNIRIFYDDWNEE